MKCTGEELGNEPNTIETSGGLWCDGYQSCAWGPKITASSIQCNAEQSCAGNTTPMNGVGKTECNGQRACSLVKM